MFCQSKKQPKEADYHKKKTFYKLEPKLKWKKAKQWWEFKILCSFSLMTHPKSRFIMFQSQNTPPPPEVRRGPEGLKQVRQVRADSQKTSRPPRPDFGRTTANNTCPDDVRLSEVSHTRLKTYSVLNLLLLHLSVPSVKPSSHPVPISHHEWATTLSNPP